jgi:hypothetical protein
MCVKLKLDTKIKDEEKLKKTWPLIKSQERRFIYIFAIIFVLKLVLCNGLEAF